MKRVMTVATVVMVLGFAVAAGAQQSAPPADPHRHGAPTPAPTPQPGTPPAAQGQGHGQGHGAGGGMPMEMCQQMMGGGMMGGGMMGGGMMGGGMMGGGMMGGMQGMQGMGGMHGMHAMDPKTLEMRGEMMKAMGEIMLKHARRMNATGAPAKKQ